MLRRVVLSMVLSSVPFMAMANEPETPTSLKGGKVITADEGGALSKSKGAVFVDTRSALNFGKGHVPGAVSVAYKEKSDKVENFDGSQDQFEFAKMPADKAAKIVFYSDGPTGWKSYKAAVLSIKQLGSLTTTQVAAMETRDVAVLTQTQIRVMTTTQVVALSTAQVVALTTGQVGALTAGSVTALSSGQVAALTNGQLGALSTAQVQAIDVTDVAAMSTTQVNALT